MASKVKIENLTPIGAYRIALRLARDERFAEAREYLVFSAGKRCSHALYALATWFLMGRSFRVDRRRAVCLLKQAVDLGNSDACFDLAVCYETGQGVPQDEEAAFDLYLRAATSGDTSASLEVGRMLYWGLGVQKDYDRARSYFLRAARGRSAEAAYYLGLIWEYGDGTRVNLKRAREWYSKAAGDTGEIGELARERADALQSYESAPRK